MGEKLSDLEQFYPERMASRILGMGDVLSMIEKAQENIDEEQAKKLEQKMRKNEFDFEMYLIDESDEQDGRSFKRDGHDAGHGYRWRQDAGY